MNRSHPAISTAGFGGGACLCYDTNLVVKFLLLTILRQLNSSDVRIKTQKGGSIMEVHHPVFYVSLGLMQNSMRSSVTLKLTLTLTDTGGAVLTLMLGYRPGGELP